MLTPEVDTLRSTIFFSFSEMQGVRFAIGIRGEQTDLLMVISYTTRRLGNYGSITNVYGVSERTDILRENG